MSLHKIDGKIVSRGERELAGLLDRPALRIALSQGWLLSMTTPLRDAEVGPLRFRVSGLGFRV
jgi:hypothetical protein